jgi:predicted aspartyl protease
MRWKDLIVSGCLIAVAASSQAQDRMTESVELGVPAAGQEVRLERDGGTYRVPVIINGAITLKFILDSGASDVLIPADVFLTLLRTGTVSESDFLGSQTYSLADGSKLKGARFIIRELKVGGYVATNVVASVGPVSGDLLLGLSFLSKFGAVTLDNERHVLILSNRGVVQPRVQQERGEQPTATLPERREGAVGGNGESRSSPTKSTEHARYSLTDCRSIIDRTTELESYVGPDSNVSWPEANKWIQELRNCAKTWAMPSISQLKTLFDASHSAGTGYYTRGTYWPAHIDPVFSDIGKGSWVWARGTPDAEGAPAFNFNQGISVRISPTNREFTVRAFAVKHPSE